MTELGNRLRERRNELNISLDDLQDITKIQKRYLLAIEEGRYDVLPGKFYARAFIRQYAEAVELDPQTLFEEFKAELPDASEDTDVSESLSRVKTKERAVNDVGSRLLAILPKVLVFVFIIGAAVTIWVMRQDGGDNIEAEHPNDQSLVDESSVESEVNHNVTPEVSSEKAEPEEENLTEQNEDQDLQTEEEPASNQVLEIVEVNDSGSTPYTTYHLKQADKFYVSVTANEGGRSYVGIKNGKGKSFFEGEISDGESKEFDFSNENEIEFNIGYTPSVTILVNDEELSFQLSKAHQKFKIVVGEE